MATAFYKTSVTSAAWTALLLMSVTASASWIESDLGFSTPAKADNGTVLGQLPEAHLSIGSDGRPQLSFYSGGARGLYTRLCTGKEGQYRLNTFAMFDLEVFTLPYSCSFGKYPSLSFYPRDEDEANLIQLFKHTKGEVHVSIDGVNFRYSAAGFTNKYTLITQRAKERGVEIFQRSMNKEAWLSGDLSVMGYNTYGRPDSDSPSAQIFINRGGIIGVGFMFGIFQGAQIANNYCNSGIPVQGLFNIPSMNINGTKVKMMGDCEKYVDTDVYYMMAYPVTARGRKHIIQSFMSNNHVKIDNAFYPAKGFKQAYTSLQESVGGI